MLQDWHGNKRKNIPNDENIKFPIRALNQSLSCRFAVHTQSTETAILYKQSLTINEIKLDQYLSNDPIIRTDIIHASAISIESSFGISIAFISFYRLPNTKETTIKLESIIQDVKNKSNTRHIIIGRFGDQLRTNLRQQY